MSAPVVIEKGVPVPAGRWDYESGYWTALRALEVGDSFVVPDGYKAAMSMAGLANRSEKPKKFTSRKVDGGRHIWRIA